MTQEPVYGLLRVLVTGSRAWPYPALLFAALMDTWHDATTLHGPGTRLLIVHGACPTGADWYADTWADRHGHPREPHEADWSRGRRGGPERNARMAALGAALCLAAPWGASPGTRNCITEARRADIPVRLIEGPTAA